MSDINKNIDKTVKRDKEQEDKEVSDLCLKIEEITKERYEERFLWILTFVLLLDIFFLKDCQNWSLPIVIGIIELIIILSVGQKLGIDFLSSLLEKILTALGHTDNKK